MTHIAAQVGHVMVNFICLQTFILVIVLLSVNYLQCLFPFITVLCIIKSPQDVCALSLILPCSCTILSTEQVGKPEPDMDWKPIMDRASQTVFWTELFRGQSLCLSVVDVCVLVFMFTCV